MAWLGQVDLGCGSGSLLEVLLKEPNTLEHIVGIDTSRKALVRAAKVIDSLPFTVIRIASQGSLHLSGFDIFCNWNISHQAFYGSHAQRFHIMTRMVPLVCDGDADIEYNPNEAHSR